MDGRIATGADMDSHKISMCLKECMSVTYAQTTHGIVQNRIRDAGKNGRS
jgi:hypothetical protein